MKLAQLYGIILSRKDQKDSRSYTASLFQAGLDAILQKVGEESVELILAGKGQSDQRVIEEAADLAYHSLVLLAQRGIPLEAIEEELEKRHQVKTKPV